MDRRAKALGAASKAYADLGGVGALLATFVALLVVSRAGACALGADVKTIRRRLHRRLRHRLCELVRRQLGASRRRHAGRPGEVRRLVVAASSPTRAAIIVALIVGLVIANVFPRFAEWLKEAIRPELYIKIAIVILGAFIAVTAAGKLNLASSLLLRGVAAIVEAYLIYWSVVYFIARKWFGFSREWAAPLASGISICGVAAAIATGGAIRARPQVPVLVSSLVVVFAVVEVLILPFVAQTFLSQRAAGRRRLARPGGQDRRRGGRGRRHHGVADPRPRRRRRASNTSPAGCSPSRDGQGVHRHLHRRLGVHPRLYLDQPHQRRRRRREGASRARSGSAFPKFILGFVATFAIGRCALALGGAAAEAGRRDRRSQHLPRHLLHPDLLLDRRAVATSASCGAKGFGKLAAVYLVSLFGFVIWVGLDHLLAVLRRRQAAARRLRRGPAMSRTRIARRIEGAGRAAAADREEADRLEPRRRRGACSPCWRSSTISCPFRDRRGGAADERLESRALHEVRAGADARRARPARPASRSPRRVSSTISAAAPATAPSCCSRRFPAAKVVGVDTSEAMLAHARARAPGASFVKQDIADWAPDDAARSRLRQRGAAFPAGSRRRCSRACSRCVAEGGCLAVQMPSALSEASHAAMRLVAADGPWARRLAPIAKTRAGDRRLRGLLRMAARAGAEVEMWTTVYVHAFDGSQGDRRLVRRLRAQAVPRAARRRRAGALPRALPRGARRRLPAAIGRQDAARLSAAVHRRDAVTADAADQYA